MNDFVIDDISVHLRASKQKDYQERVILRFRNFVEFLQREKLTTRTLLSPNAQPSSDFRVMKSDLTEQGFQVVKKAYDKWLKGQDQGRAPTDLSALESELKKIRSISAD